MSYGPHDHTDPTTREPHWTISALVQYMHKLEDRLSALERERAGNDSNDGQPLRVGPSPEWEPTPRLRPDRCTCPPDWSSQGKHMLGCPLIAYLNRPPTSKVSPPPQPSQPQPGAGVETLAVDDDSILCIMQKEIRDSGATKLRYLHARDAQVSASARAKAIDDCLKAVQHITVPLDSGGQTLVNACNALRTLKEQG